MSQAYQSRGLIAPIMLALVCVVSCSSPSGVPHEAGATHGEQAPFQNQLAESAKNEGQPSTASEDVPGAERNLPFHDSETLPAGTLITVRLKGAILADAPGQHTGFEAVVEEPVTVEGMTLIPRGAAVMGRVQSARTSEVKPSRGYVRLALESVNVGGADISLRTASLFARQTPVRDISTSTIGVEKGRRLIFRLLEPANLSAQRTHARR